MLAIANNKEPHFRCESGALLLCAPSYAARRSAASLRASSGDNVSSHFLTYGLRMYQADIANQTAVWLAKDHRIVFGTDLGSAAGTWVTITAAGLFDIRNANIAQNGTQVVKGRKTGWGTATGTVDRTAFAAYTAPTYTAVPTMADMQALANQVQSNSRHLAALIQDLHGSTNGHGLIGA